MSRQRFIASANPLTALPNPWVRAISIEEAMALEMDLPDFLLENPDIDRTEPVIQICESEEHLDELEIMPLAEPETWIRGFTDLPCLAEINGRYSLQRAQRLIDYVNQALALTQEVELWQIGPGDLVAPFVRRIPLAQLTVETLRFFDGSDGTEYPQGLIIRR